MKARLRAWRRSVAILAITLLGLAFGVTAGAAPVGTTFTYQGQLTLGGSPVNGLYDFEIRLFDAEEGGSQLGAPATKVDIDVDGGLFVLELDFGLAVFTADEALWLEISTRPADTATWTELSPRQPLRPTPYALRSQSQAWAGLTDLPAGFADHVDDDTLAALPCGSGEVPVWGGSSWTCEAAGTGDITSVLPGPGCGLTGGALSGDAELCISFATAQRRVTGACPPDGAIQSINEDGSVVCTVPEPTGYTITGDTGWLSVPNRTGLDIDLGTTDYDFVFGVIRGGDNVSGPIYQPVMGSLYSAHLRAYVGLSGSTLTLYNYRYTGFFQNLGDWSDVRPTGGEIKLTAVDRSPDYSSGWQPCASGITYVFNHGLGTDSTLAIVEVAENSDGSGWRVPTMSTSNFDGISYRQTNIVALDSQNVTLRTHGSLAHLRAPPSEAILTPGTGFCRVQLFSWTPDYDSGWVSLSTAIADRVKWLKHDLGAIPRVFMLWIAQNADGSGWRLPAMSNVQRSGADGTQIYNLTDRWVTVKSGSTYVGQFIDGAGAGQNATSGYVRFVAWR